MNITAYQDALRPAIMPIPDAIYRGCGKCWVAVADGQIVAIRYMGECPGKRDFGEFRQQMRAELAALGQVLSGTASCFEFLPRDAEQIAIEAGGLIV